MSFSDLGLLPALAESLAAQGLVTPTSVQRIAVPAILGGASVVVVARTGSGKTLAYGLPLIQRLHTIEAEVGLVTARASPRAVILTGTRELVDQTMRAVKSAAHALKARVRAASGGLTERQQRLQLAEPLDILIANPPRLVQLLRAGQVDLSDVRALVVDEADTLLSPGQRSDVEALLAAIPRTAALAYISATLPEPIRAWLLVRPERPALLLSKDAHSAPETVTVQNVKVKPVERLDATHDALVAMPSSARGILFCNRRETADRVGATLKERGHAAVVIHGALAPEERRRALKAFRGGEGRVLVTTELGGRGLHLDDLAFVLNYDLPEKASEYLHRIGRVGRQGAQGKVVNLVTADDAALLGQIERLKAGGRLDTGEKLRPGRERRPPPEKPKRPPARKGDAKLGGKPAAKRAGSGTKPGGEPAKAGPKAAAPTRGDERRGVEGGGRRGAGGGVPEADGGRRGRGSGRKR